MYVCMYVCICIYTYMYLVKNIGQSTPIAGKLNTLTPPPHPNP